MLHYKLIVSDFDGTLRRTEGGISEGNIRAVGDSMSSDLKETARGGLASTPTARIIVKELIRKNQFHSEN